MVMDITGKTLELDFLGQEIESYENVNIESLLIAETASGETGRDESQNNTPRGDDENPHFACELQWDYKDDYDDYNHVEKHVNFSENLYNLNKRGYYLMDELRRKKPEGDALLESIIGTLKITLKNKLSGTCTLMNELYCYLDELLFTSIDEDNINAFFIGEDAYPITKIYYGQESWIGESIYLQNYSFVKSKYIEEGEMMVIACFYNDYLTLLEKIMEYVEGVGIKCDSIRLLTTNIGKLTSILDRAKLIILDKIGSSISLDDCES